MNPLIKSVFTTIFIVAVYFTADYFLSNTDVYKKNYSEFFSSLMIALAVFFWYHFFKTEKGITPENHDEEKN